jgi:hypothetical protein
VFRGVYFDASYLETESDRIARSKVASASSR